MKSEITTALIFLFLFYGCKENITEPAFVVPAMPELADNIPYTALGSGKIVFQRIGPMGNSYEGIYILDINNKKSWGINFAPIDAPQISPEGDKISFSKLTDLESYWDVYTSDIYGNNTTRISSGKGQDRCPSWFEDNHRIIYYLDSFNNNEYIPVFIYDLANNSTKYVLDFGKIDFPSIYGLQDNISVSKNNVCLVNAGGRLCTFGLNGENFKWISANSYYSPTWNPSGNTFAVISIKIDSVSTSGTDDTYNQEMNILLFHQDGSNMQKIFTTKEVQTGMWAGNKNYSLCWSPDGSKILFNIRESYLTSHIYMINSDGSNFTVVTSITGVTDRSLSWGK